MEHPQLIDAFSEFKDLKNIDRASMMSILEDVFRGMIKKKYGTADNFDIVINTDKGDLEAFRNRLIVPDGNWGQTNRMLSRVAVLRRARPVRLERPRLDFACVRHNEGTDRRSTFEAIAQALGIIEGGVVEDRMLDFFRLVLSRKNQYRLAPARLSASGER